MAFGNGTLFNLTEKGQVTSISMYLNNTDTVTRTIKFAIFSHNDITGRPEGLIEGTSVSGTIGAGSYEWKTLTINPPVTLEPGKYWIVASASGSGVVKNYYDIEEGYNSTDSSCLYANFPCTPWPGSAWMGAEKVTAFFNYTPLQAWSNVTKNLNTTTGALVQWRVYANDTADNWNTSEIFSLITISKPQWSDNKEDPSPATYSPNQNYQFNVTWDDHYGISVVLIEHNFTGSSSPHNNTVDDYRTISGNKREYYFNVTDLPAGTYVWKEYANDTYDYWNITNDGTYWSYTVSKASTSMNLYLNGTDGDEDYNSNETVNITADLNVSFDVEIWTNFTGSYDLWDSGSDPLMNYTSMNYGIGPFNITANFSGNQNYTASYDSHTLTVWGWSNISWTSPDFGIYVIGNIITLNCSVLDANTSVSVSNYPVYFYNQTETESSLIGMNLTDSSGYAFYNWNTSGAAEGTYYPKCNITDNSTIYYNASEDYQDNTTVNLTANEPPQIWNLAVRDSDDNVITQTQPARYVNITVNVTDVNDNIDYVEGNFTMSNGTMVYANFTPVSNSLYNYNWTYLVPIDTPNGTALINVSAYDTNGVGNSTNTTLTITTYAELSLTNTPVNFSIQNPGINATALPNQGWPLYALVQGNVPVNLTQNASEYLVGIEDPTVSIYIRNITWNTSESGVFTQISVTEMVINESVQPGYYQPIYYRLYIPPVKNQSYGGMVYIHGEYS